MTRQWNIIILKEKYTNAEKIVAHYRNWAEDIEWMGESFPSLFADFGPGSVAAYLGCDITWQERTVWFNEIMDEDDEWDDIPPLKFDPRKINGLRNILNLLRNVKNFQMMISL